MRVRLLVALMVVGLGGCPATRGGVEVKTLVFPALGLAGYVSYAWAGGARPVGQFRGSSSPGSFDVDAETRRLIEVQLRIQGMVASDRAPDCHAFFVMAAKAHVWVDELKRRYGPQADISRFEDQSVLVLGLLDAQTRKPIWIVAVKAPAKTEYHDPEAREQLKRAIERVFRKLSAQP